MAVPALGAKPVDQVSVPKSTDLGTAIVKSGSFIGELVRADTMLQVADAAFEAVDGAFTEMRGLAELSAQKSLSQFERAVLDRDFQTIVGGIHDVAGTTEVDGEKILAGGDGPNRAYEIHLSSGGEDGKGLDLVVPSMLVKDLSPGLVGANIQTRDAAIEAVKHTNIAIESVAIRRDMIAEQRHLVHQMLSTELAHNALLVEIAGTFDGAQFAAELAYNVSQAVLTNSDSLPFEVSADRLRDILEQVNQDDQPGLAPQT